MKTIYIEPHSTYYEKYEYIAEASSRLDKHGSFITREMIEWCEENINGEYQVICYDYKWISNSWLEFQEINDYILFQLCWSE